MALSDANITGLYFLASATIPAVIPVLILLINNRTARSAAEAARKEAALAAKAVADAATARDNVAAEQRGALVQSVAESHKIMTEVKVQTDGLIGRVADLAEAKGVAVGEASGQKTGEATGKARAEEVQAVVKEAVDAAGKDQP